MPKSPFTSPVEDSVPMIDGSIAVGEDLEFQRKWWRFERMIWIFFAIILLCDLLGVFGRGVLSKATRVASDQTMTVDYERIARASTPSIMTLKFGASAIHDGKIQIYVSNSIVKPLGAQRISPQPAVSSLGNDGITYDFAATSVPADVQIELSPSFPGLHHFRMQVVGGSPVDGSIFVVP